MGNGNIDRGLDSDRDSLQDDIDLDLMMTIFS